MALEPCSKPRWKKLEFFELFRQKQEDRHSPEGQFLAQINLKMMLRLHAGSRERFLTTLKFSTKIEVLCSCTGCMFPNKHRPSCLIFSMSVFFFRIPELWTECDT